jgi:hemolysin III
VATLPADIRHRRADAAVHVVGLLAVLAACLLLASRAAHRPEPLAAAAFGLYALGLVASFTCSAAYNMATPGPRRALLRRLDHAAIFLLIAGTYTPIMALAVGGWTGFALLLFVWTGALLGGAIKLAAPARFERVAIAAYLLLGWVGVIALMPLLRALSSWQLGLLLLGGLIYSLGVIAHVSKTLPYNIAIWHALVLVAAGCQYVVVLSLAPG